jgi:hypothetical protein
MSTRGIFEWVLRSDIASTSSKGRTTELRVDPRIDGIMIAELARFSLGRVLLHLISMLGDRAVRFHAAGIMRELSWVNRLAPVWGWLAQRMATRLPPMSMRSSSEDCAYSQVELRRFSE